MEAIYNILLYIFIFMTGVAWKKIAFRVYVFGRMVHRFHVAGYSVGQYRRNLAEERARLDQDLKEVVKKIIKKNYPNIEFYDMDEDGDREKLIDSVKDYKKEEMK